jgi:hypothetical protein
MSPKDFEKPFDPLTEVARELHSAIGSPFEDQITEGYRAKVHLPVTPNSAFFTKSSYRDYIQLTSGSSADSHKAWELHLGYDANEKEIGVAGLAIPLQSTASENRSLLFRATERHGFLRFLLKGDIDTGEILPAPIDQTEPVNPAFVGKLLMSAGYDLRQFSTEPNTLRLQLAALVDGSDDATITERVATESKDGILATFTRVTKCSSVVGALHTPNQTTDYASSLEATFEFKHREPKLREQLVIHYPHADFVISLPTITKRLIARKETVLAQPDEAEYTVVSEVEVPATIVNMGRLSESMFDVLSDNQ